MVDAFAGAFADVDLTVNFVVVVVVAVADAAAVAVADALELIRRAMLSALGRLLWSRCDRWQCDP